MKNGFFVFLLLFAFNRLGSLQGADGGIECVVTPSKLAGLIARFEGFSSDAFIDTPGKYAIGYGHLITDSPSDLALKGKKLTKEEGLALLSEDIRVRANIRPVLKVKVNSAQFDALTSLCFNIGLGNFSKSQVLSKVNAGDFTGAAEYFCHWRKGGGKILPGLIKRRFAEMFIFFDLVLDPTDDRPPSVQWGWDPMEKADDSWGMINEALRAEAVKIYEGYKEGEL
jgi:lysozyme